MRQNFKDAITKDDPLKIGMNGERSVGKSTFIEGFFPDPKIEDIKVEWCYASSDSVFIHPDLNIEWQLLREDCSLTQNGYEVPFRTLPGIDFFEHTQFHEGIENGYTQLDISVFLREEEKQNRTIFLEIPKAILDYLAFQDFLAETDHLRLT